MGRELPQRDLPQRDLPQRDLPQRDLPQREPPQREPHQREPHQRWQRGGSYEGFRGGSQREHPQQGGVRGPPTSPYGRDEEEHWKDKRNPSDEVQIALDRARIRQEEEEKR